MDLWISKSLQVNSVKDLNHIVVLCCSSSRLGNIWPRGTEYETDLLLHQKIIEYFVSKASITLSMKSEIENVNKMEIKIEYDILTQIEETAFTWSLLVDICLEKFYSSSCHIVVSTRHFLKSRLDYFVMQILMRKLNHEKSYYQRVKQT